MAGIKLQIDFPRMGLAKALNNPRPKTKVKEIVKTIKVKDRRAEAKVSALESKLRKAKDDLAMEKKRKPKTRTITKTKIVREKGNNPNLEKQLRTLKNSIPTTMHIGGDV